MARSRNTVTRSYILRVHNEEPDAQKEPRWRYVLLDPHREYRRGFTRLDCLFSALCSEIGEDASMGNDHADIVRCVEAMLRSGSAHEGGGESC